MFRAARRRIGFPTIILAVSIAFVAPCFAQMKSPNDANAPRVTVSGTVVNSETNQPIPRALIEMMQYAMLTDDRGQFRFEGVPVMSTQIRATKPGYFSLEQIVAQTATSGYASMVNVADGMAPVIVKLVPEGIISGQVSSTDREPLDSIPIVVSAEAVQNGVRVWNRRNVTVTDDEGYFRIADLAPGTYYLSAGPSRNNAEQLAAASTPHQGYAVAFYPSVPDMASASPIVITPGRHVLVDFSLRREPFYRVSGRITGFAALPNLSVTLFGADGVTVFGAPVNRRTSEFQFNSVSPGSYVLRAIAQGAQQTAPRPPEIYSARIALTVDRDISNISLSLAPQSMIEVNCRIDSTSYQQAGGGCPLSMQFSPLDKLWAPGMGNGIPQVSYTRTGEESRLEVRAGDPGHYAVNFQTNGNYYVASATFANIDLLRQDFVIGDESPGGSIEIVLREGASQLRAQVAAPLGEQDAMVFAVPEDSPNAVQVTRSGPSGNAQFWSLAPGAYKVFAVDRADDLEYRKPGALDQFLGSATRVTIGENQQASVTAPLIHREN